MTQATPSRSASSAPIKTYSRSVGPAAETGSGCKVLWFERYLEPEPGAPAGYTAIDDLVAEASADPARRAALAEARGWLADTFHEEIDQTLRALRLRKGWSQADLARQIGTSQPHIARVELGEGNPTIDTCRRLAAALEIDLNTLDSALRNQQVQNAARRAP